MAVLRAAAWKISDQNGFTDADVEHMLGCLSVDRPWRCIAAITGGRDFDRVLIVQVNPGKAKSELVLEGQIPSAEHDVPPTDQQYCNAPCDEVALRNAANELTTRLLRAFDTAPPPDATRLDVHTRPAGAAIAVDGIDVGTSDHPLVVTPGKHSIAIDLAGYRHETRDVTIEDGRTQTLDVALVPVVTTVKVDQPKHSLVLPYALVGIGGGAIVGGVLALVLDDPSSTAKIGPQRQFYYDTTTPGYIAIGAGVVAAAVGTVLWFHWRNAPAAPTVSLVPNGAALGITGAF
jgi:hypothetical protein